MASTKAGFWPDSKADAAVIVPGRLYPFIARADVWNSVSIRLASSRMALKMDSVLVSGVTATNMSPVSLSNAMMYQELPPLW